MTEPTTNDSAQSTRTNWRPSVVARLWLSAVVIVPALLLIVVFRFNGLYGQDAYAYYQYAMGPLRDAILTLQTPPPFFWPPGYPLMVSTASLLFGTAPWVGQAVSIAAVALVPIGVSLLAVELSRAYTWQTSVPWLAGILVGMTGMLWRAGIVTMADGAGVALATFGVWAAVRYRSAVVDQHASGWGWCVLAALLMGAAAMTRIVYGLVMVPTMTYIGLTWYASRKHAPWWPFALSIVTYTMIVSPLWIPMLFRGVNDPGFGGSFQVHVWNPLNAARSSFEGIDGVREYRFPNWFFYGATFARGFFFTPLLAPFLFVGAWYAARRVTRSESVLLLGWPLILFTFLVGDEYQNARFALAALPPMAILLAIGIHAAGERLGAVWRKRLATWVVIGMVAMVLGGTSYIGRVVAQKNRDVSTVRWALSQIPQDAQLLTFALTQTFSFESDLPIHDLYVVSRAELQDLVHGRDTYVVLDMQNIAEQWRDHAPGLNHQWLRDTRRLVPVGQHNAYTLFHVMPASDSISRGAVTR